MYEKPGRCSAFLLVKQFGQFLHPSWPVLDGKSSKGHEKSINYMGVGQYFVGFLKLTLADWLSLAGIIVSLLGFGFGLWQLWLVKTAAESARDAAQLAKEGVRRLDSIIGFTSVSRSIDEIKEACRKDDFDRLPTLFDQARKSLITARQNNPAINEIDNQSIQRSLVFFKTMEIEVLRNDHNILSQNKAKYIRTLIDISDDITMLANKVKSEEAA